MLVSAHLVLQYTPYHPHIEYETGIFRGNIGGNTKKRVTLRHVNTAVCTFEHLGLTGFDSRQKR